MKKKCFIIIIISAMALSGCLNQSPTQDENENMQNNRDLSDRNVKIFETYESFLRGDLFAKGAAIGEGDFSDEFFIDELNYFTEGDKFTICDVNGDGIPDLYLNSTICQIVITHQDGQLELLHYSFYSDLLSNGAWLFTRLGGAPTHIFYLYQEENFSVEFVKYDFDESGQYDYENEDAFDLFEINGIAVSKEEWENVAAKYLIDLLPVQWIIYPGNTYEGRIIPEDIAIATIL